MINTDYYYSIDQFYYEDEECNVDAYIEAWDKLSAELTVAGCYNFRLFVEQELYRYTAYETQDKLSSINLHEYVRTHLIKRFDDLEIKALFDIYRDDIRYLIGMKAYLNMKEGESYRYDCLKKAYEKQLDYILRSV